MSKKKETKLQKDIRDAISSIANTRCWKNHGSMYSEAGRPDIDGFTCAIFDGVSLPIHFTIEVKIPGEVLKPHQEVAKEEIISKGGLHLEATTVQLSVDFVESIRDLSIFK